MDLQKTFLVLISIMIVSCNTLYIKSTDGIEVESIKQLQEGNEYTIDNRIYTGKKELTYDYTLIKEGKEYYFKSQNDYSNLRDGWELVAKNNVDSNTITQIKMIVLEDQGQFSGKDSYRESVVEYQYLTPKGIPYFKTITKIGEQTGLIENKKNIWLHPPRSYLFKITELNPWPYIKYPIKRDRTWDWELEIGDKWSDDRWKSWKGNIQNKYTYKIEGQELINSVWGELSCTKIIAEARSRIGSTKLTSYFNKKHGGFIQLEYTNIDGSKLKMELRQIKH